MLGQVSDTLEISEVTVVSFYRNSATIGSVVEPKELVESNYGQEPSHVFSQMPSIINGGKGTPSFRVERNCRISFYYSVIIYFFLQIYLIFLKNQRYLY